MLRSGEPNETGNRIGSRCRERRSDLGLAMEEQRVPHQKRTEHRIMFSFPPEDHSVNREGEL